MSNKTSHLRKQGVSLLTFALTLTILLGFSGKANSANPKGIDWEYQIAYQRGIEVMNWGLPAVSMLALRDAYFSLGGGFNIVYYLSEVPSALQEALTANNQTPYASILLSTHDGPVVVEVPPATQKTAIFGSATNVWQVPVTDIGPAGTDQGKGGRYLFLPPGYDGEIPDDVFPIELDQFGVYIALRCIPLGDTTFAEAAEYAKQLKAYPLNEMGNPPPGQYIDRAGKRLPTLPEYDLSFFGRISQLLEEEPLLRKDMVMGGMLASIGIQKGKPFAPQGKVKQALERAAEDGYAYLEHMFETPGYSMERYWSDRQWLGILEPSEDGFVFDEGEYLLLDARGSLYHWATFIPRRLGKASAYLALLRDSDGELLSGNAQYRLRVPKDVPARDFWSVIAYSKKTKAFIYNDTGRVGLSSYDKANMKLNDDGSVDIYFGQQSPRDLETNWVPNSGEDFFLLFRFYGPEQAFFDRSFKLPDLEEVD